MARYVSRYAQPVIILRNDESKLVYLEGSDRAHREVTKRALIAEFQPGLESTFEKNFARAAFAGKLKYFEDGTVSFGDYMLTPMLHDGEMHEMRLGGALPDTAPFTRAIPDTNIILEIDGYDITQKMSTFDTTQQGWTPEEQKEAERLLDMNAGVDYFKVGKTKVAPPWPSYDEMRQGQGSHQRVYQQVKDLGYNPAMIVAYEEQMDDPKQGIINMMGKLHEEIVAEQAEREALTTRVD